MADANSAYTLKDIDLFKEIDKLNLLMIEQLLSHDDIVDHAKLQAVLNTRIFLDESIHSVDDARHAIELGAAIGLFTYPWSGSTLGGGGNLVAGIVLFISMYLISKYAGNYPRLQEPALGIAMLIGMFTAAILVD